MAILIETATSYGTDASGSVGFNHNVISASGKGRMTLALLHSVSADNAAFTGLGVTGITPTFLATLSSLRSGLYHRLDVYYAGDVATGAAGSKVLTATAGASMHNIEIAVLTFTGVRQQAPTNYGNVASKAAKVDTPAWVGVQGTSGLYGLNVRQADATGTPLAGTVSNVCGYVPATNDSDTCQALLYLADVDLSSGLLISADY